MVSFFLYFLLALLAPVEVDVTHYQELIPVFPFGSVEFDWKVTK